MPASSQNLYQRRNRYQHRYLSTKTIGEILISCPKQHSRQHGNNARFDNDNDKHIWHQVDGKRKWRPAYTVMPAATLPVGSANPRVNRSWSATVPPVLNPPHCVDNEQRY
jgi:hypothetical protein